MDDFFRSVLGTGLESKDIDVLQMALRAVIIYVVTICIYVVTICIVRIGKKRFMGGATVFDVILGIIVGSVASQSLSSRCSIRAR